MNERIKELVKQATTEEADGFKYFDKEKFAQLIVLECAEVSFKHWEQYKNCSAHFSIREHFGVE